MEVRVLFSAFSIIILIFFLILYSIKLLRKIECANETFEFFFTKPTEYIYRSGQHAGLILNVPTAEGGVLRHTFSFTSSPNNTDEISFLTRIRDSEFKKHLSSLNIGDEAQVALPGGFEIADNLISSDNFIYLSAGVGITPLLSYLRNNDYNSTKGDCTLIWSNRTPDTTPYFELFTEGEFRKLDNFQSKLFMTDSKSSKNYSIGRIDQNILREIDGLKTPSTYYVIGMPSFVDSMTSQLITIGVPFEKIITENFSGY